MAWFECSGGSSGGGSSHTYSTTEHTVGTWIDGSTVYEKTIATEFGHDVSSKSIDLTSLNINKLIYVDGFIIASDSGDCVMIGYNNAGNLGFNGAVGTSVTVKRAGGSSWGMNPEIYVTIRYTKAGS